ncbi:hypothetical protein BM1_06209 [Bipolaris maydis]|nr:hypothetical protein BM1_06209 [Bipolaris maydis]
MPSSIPGLSTKLTPIYPSSSSAPQGDEEEEESPTTQSLISSLHLQKHIEGGYFAELDRNPLLIPNPFLQPNSGDAQGKDEVKRTAEKPASGDDTAQPMGKFHRNKGRTVHTLISGRGRYVLIHADEPGAQKRVESFVTVIPGFEYSDHDFLTLEGFRKIVTPEQAEELEWLVRKS